MCAHERTPFASTFLRDQIVEDEVPLRYQRGDFTDDLFFTPHTPQSAEVDLAVGTLNPISIKFHQVGGSTQMGCFCWNGVPDVFPLKQVQVSVLPHTPMIL